MSRELGSSILMSFIIILFFIPLADMSGEAQIFPSVLIVAMSIFNFFQYLMAYVYHQMNRTKPLVKLSYPYKRVGAIFLVILACMGFFDRFGFYPVSFILFLTVSLIAQPMPLTWKGFFKRAFGCGLFVFALYMLFTVGLEVQIP